jgi:hypothetical protein
VCQKSVPVITTAISKEKEWAWNFPADHPCYATRDDNTGQEKEEEKEEVVGCTKLTRRRPTGAAQQLSYSYSCIETDDDQDIALNNGERAESPAVRSVCCSRQHTVLVGGSFQRRLAYSTDWHLVLCNRLLDPIVVIKLLRYFSLEIGLRNQSFLVILTGEVGTVTTYFSAAIKANLKRKEKKKKKLVAGIHCTRWFGIRSCRCCWETNKRIECSALKSYFLLSHATSFVLLLLLQPLLFSQIWKP